MKTNLLKWGSILSYLQMAMNIVIGLVYTPVMIRLLGQSEYGLYQTAASVISMLGILNLGFNAGYIRYFAKYKLNDDKNSIYKLNGLFLIIFSVIGIVALLCGLVICENIKLVFDTGLTSNEYVIAKKLLIISVINLAVSFPMSVFSTIISACEKFIFLKVIGMIKTVVSPLVSLPLLLMGYRSVALVTVSLILSLITDFIYVYYVLNKLKFKFIFHDFEKGLFKSLFAYTAFIALNLIIDQINWNIDKLLLARFKGTTAVAIYSVGSNLYNFYMLFSTSISGVFTPRVHKIVNQTRENLAEQRKQLTDLFVKIGRIQYLLLALIASGVVFFGKQFILNIWVGKGYDDSYYVALLLIIPASIALTQNVGIEIQRAENKHQFRSIVYTIMALVNLVLSIILCQKYGAIGSAIGTAISLILANGIIMNIYYQKKCNIMVTEFWKNIMKMSAGLIAPIIVGVLLNKFVNLNNIVLFFVSIVIYSVVYVASMWLIAMNKYEKELVIKPIKTVLRKVKK